MEQISTTSSTLDSLLAELAANEEQNKSIKVRIAEEQHNLVLPDLISKYVGKHFKRIDKYETGSTIVYSRVVGLPKPGVADVVQFDHDPDRMFIYSETEGEYLEDLGGQITAEEYNAAAQRALARLKF